MTTTPITRKEISSLRKYSMIAIVAWTALTVLSAYWNIISEKKKTLQLVEKEALATFNKDHAFRLWATKHGGVYVPISDETPSNPNLAHISDRDITTPSGKNLTLMNPAYMLRQVMTDYNKLYGIKGKITSLRYLNPINSPDAWERTALQAFDRGTELVREIATLDGKPYYRLIQPLFTQKGCLKCHARQGYREGDVRGGVATYVPMTPYLKLEQSTVWNLILTHIVFWLLGTLFIGIIYSRSKTRLNERTENEARILKLNQELEQRVVERTVTLQKEIDIREQAEEALLKAHGELEQRVEERTEALQKTHNQLLHAGKLSAIGNLAASVAHEFNNPLQGVMNVIKGVQRRARLEAGDQKLVELAVNECYRMRDLIKSLQDFNRPTADRMAPMDMHAAIDSTLLLSEADHKNRGITIVKHYGDSLPQIIAVGDQIKQVILNLLNNGADACEGGGTIKITTEVHDTDIAFHLQDNGKGILPEDIDHIFEPFFTTKPEVKGTGLGLSVSYGIINNHGGSIAVASQPGSGTTFTIFLPIKGPGNGK
jgi:signal transduction histidine kinase